MTDHTDFLQYQLASERETSASRLLEFAAVNLQLAQIRKRLAELKSQSEPSQSIDALNSTNISKMIAAADWVVVGRHTTLRDVQP